MNIYIVMNYYYCSANMDVIAGEPEVYFTELDLAQAYLMRKSNYTFEVKNFMGETSTHWKWQIKQVKANQEI